MSIDHVSYRLATPDDQVLLDDMNVMASFPWRGEDRLPTAEDFFRFYPNAAGYSSGFGRPGDLGLIASDENGRPVAAIWGRYYIRDAQDGVWQEHPFEITMATREVARRQGIGRQLLDSFSVMAWLKGYNEISLGVDSERGMARGLYEKVGFRPLIEADGSEAKSDEYTVMTRPLGLMKVKTIDDAGESSDGTGPSSLAEITLRGMNEKKLNRISTTTYHVLDGEGVMNIDGTKVELKKGVTVEVPPNTPYFDLGNVDMMAISTPPFNPADVEELPFGVED